MLRVMDSCNNRKNRKRAGDDGKRETAFPLPIVPGALSFSFSQPPHNTKRPLRRREAADQELRKGICVCLSVVGGRGGKGLGYVLWTRVLSKAYYFDPT